MKKELYIFITVFILLLTGCPGPGELVSTTSLTSAPLSTAASCNFFDTDPDQGQISGILNIVHSIDESDINQYTIYWGSSDSVKLSTEEKISEITAENTDLAYFFPDNSVIPGGATHILVFAQNNYGESEQSVAAKIDDTTTILPPVPLSTAVSCNFLDTDLDQGQISGDLYIVHSADESDINQYTIYWGSSDSVKLSTEEKVSEITAENTDLTFIFPDNSVIPEGATHILVFAQNNNGESERSVSTKIDDIYLKLLKDINSSGSSNPSDFIIYGDTLYFKAEDFSNGIELWKTDGVSGASLVKNIGPGSSNSFIKEMTLFSNMIFFHAYDGTTFNLWQTNGTNSGTVKVDSNMYDYFAPAYITPFNSALFFCGTDNSDDSELWSYDGTTISEFMNIQLSGSANPGYLTVLNSTNMIFSAADFDHGKELWKTDGTDSGTKMIKDIISGYSGSNPTDLIKCDNMVIFKSESIANGVELWSTDGTESGTNLILDIREGIQTSNPEGFTLFNDYIYFSADDGINGNELWRTNGTSASTSKVSEINQSSDSYPSQLYPFEDQLLFCANDGVNGYELWKTSGSGGSTSLIMDIDATGNSTPASFCQYNNLAYFAASTSDAGRELWVTDGTESGTRQIADINPGSDGSEVTNLFVFGDKLFFSADNGTSGSELWVYYGGSAE